MAIPDYQTIMNPLLKFTGDQREHTFREAIAHLTGVFRLTEEEQKRTYSSGRMRVFYNKVGWAQSYLKHAGLIESTKRGSFKITHEGLKLLDENPQRVDNKLLMRYPEFAEYIRGIRGRKDDGNEEQQVVSEVETPDEVLDNAYQNMRRILTRDVLEQVRQCNPDFFEELVVELLVKMGYGGSIKDAGEAIGRTGDEGIDGTIKQDLLGLDQIHVQAKRWQGTVGRPEVQKFAGALQGQRAKKGIFITTGTFSGDAADYASKIDSKIVLIDGIKLAELMIDYNLGVSSTKVYDIKKIDSDYFEA